MEYLEMAQRYATARDLSGEVKDLISEWERVLVSLARDPMELATDIDWVIKKALIESFMERKGIDWGAPQVQMLDLQYHDLRPEKGLYYVLERQGRVRRVVTDAEIERAVHYPPEDTRAYFRGGCLRRYGAQVFGVNWDSISFGIGDEPIKRVMMVEPLKGSKQHVEDLFASSPTAADLVRNLRA
jgi:proteasome accessory factor A